MIEKEAWRLSTRITIWSVVVGTGFVLLLSITAYFFQRAAAEEELDGIVREEIEEMHSTFTGTSQTKTDFADCAARLEDQHSSNRMAWKVWERDGGGEWSVFGPADLLKALAPLPPDDEVVHAAAWPLCAMAIELTPELSLGLLLDGADEAQALRRFALVAGAIVLGAVGASFLAGRFLGGRIGGALHRIATDAKTNTLGTTAPAIRGLPAEMREVVEVLHETLVRIRGESEAARLMASGLAHELRSPLHNLAMQAEVALLRERDPAEYRRLLAGQIDELQELTRAVDNLVTLCAPPEGRRAQRVESFDLAAEVHLRLRGEETHARQAGVELRIDMPERLSFRGDREGITLVLRNLLANAIEWSPPAGRVEVRLALHTDTDTGAGAGALSISVEDQGPGVPESERENIFQAFHRGARRDGRAGYGLGLALVRTVVDFHGGSVEVGTSPLGGAAFRVLLPLAQESQPGTASEEPAPSAAGDAPRLAQA